MLIRLSALNHKKNKVPIRARKMRNEVNWAEKSDRDEELVLDRIMALAYASGFECEIIDGQMIIKDSERKICYAGPNGIIDGVAVLYDYEYE